MKKKTRKGCLILALTLFAVLMAAAGLSMFSQFRPGTDEALIFIDSDDTCDSVCTKIKAAGGAAQTFRTAATLTGMSNNLHEGAYDVGSGQTVFTVIRRIRGGMQTPYRYVVPMVNTLDDLALHLSKHLRADASEWKAAFADATLLKELGTDTAMLPALFIPNTYEVYWTITPEQFLKRMKREHDTFWTKSRTQQAEALGLTPDEVVTLASIVEKESAYAPEKPRIAGMYLNRLRTGMNLCADPTVKYALRNFALRRILNVHLRVDSPYNTYRRAGLPPGPICLPSMESINAALKAEKNNYLFMCAAEDFSGRHNFASNDKEHMANARKYAEALNKRGIK